MATAAHQSVTICATGAGITYDLRSDFTAVGSTTIDAYVGAMDAPNSFPAGATYQMTRYDGALCAGTVCVNRESLPEPRGSSTASTPAPWYERSHRQIGTDEGIVAEADENVQLIASAPDMQAALRAILSDYAADMALIRPRTLALIQSAFNLSKGEKS